MKKQSDHIVLFRLVRYAFCLSGMFLIQNCKGKAPKCTDIPTLHILETGIGWEKKASCTLIVTDCGKIDTLTARTKFRGGFSSRYDKHSYTLEFDEKQKFHQKQLSKNWVLNANYIDRSFMRHKLSFDLFRQMDPKNNKAPHCEYVWVKDNSDEKGLYVLMERMDRIRLNVLKGQKGAFICKSPPIFFDHSLTPKRDSLFFDSMEFPKKKKKKKLALKHSKLKLLETLIYDADDATFRKKVFTLIDQKSFIDWQLIILFSNSGDAQLKNYCIYQTSTKAKLKIAIWDYDHSFGRDGTSEINMCERVVDEKRNPLMRRLIELNPDHFNEKLSRRYKVLRKSVFTRKNVLHLISENNKIIAPYITKNEKIWPANASWYFDKMHYKQDLTIIKRYVSLRLKQLDQRFQVKKS